MAPHHRGTEVWQERKGTLPSQQVISKNQFWAQHWPGPAHGEHSARNLFTQVFSRTRLTTWGDGSKTGYEGLWCGRDPKSHRSVEKGGRSPWPGAAEAAFLEESAPSSALNNGLGLNVRRATFLCSRNSRNVVNQLYYTSTNLKNTSHLTMLL